MIRNKRTLSNCKKIIALVLCISLTTAGFSVASSTQKENTVYAKTIEELEQQKQNNSVSISSYEKELEELQKQIDASQSNVAAQEQYQKQLSAKIALQQENINIVNQQLNELESQIADKQNKITTLQGDIEQKKADMQGSIDNFKKAVRAMYINSNNGVASVLAGATSFYDVLSRIEVIARVSRYNDKVIDDLKVQIDEMNKLEAELELQNTELEQKHNEVNSKKQEYTLAFQNLNNDYKKSQYEIDRIKQEQQQLQLSADQKKAQQETMKKAQQDIEKQIKARQEELKRQEELRKQEEERKRKESESISQSISVSESRKAVSVSVSESEKRASEISSWISESMSISEAEEWKKESELIEQSKQASEWLAKQTTPPTEPPVVTATTKTTSRPQYDGGTFQWPVPNFYYISDYYGIRDWNDQGMHYGLDISGEGVMYAPVVAGESGTVILVSDWCEHNYGKNGNCCGDGYGNYVVIDHGGKYSTLYGHCSSIAVQVGQYVERGQTIAYVGSTGWSTGAHLHFEVRVNGMTVDPLSYLMY